MCLTSKVSLKIFLAVCSGFFLVIPTYSHTMGLGGCPKVEPMKDFEMSKLLGEWYVIQKFATSSSCMKYNFTIDSVGQMRVVQTRQHFVLDKIGIDHTYTYTGMLNIPDPSIPSKMRVQFPLNIAGEADFMIYMTDYQNYAGVFTCQKILFGHTKSATILSRKSTLFGESITLLRQALEDQGVDVDDFNVVSQTNCINKEDASLNFKIDENTFTKQVKGAVHKAKGSAGKNSVVDNKANDKHVTT